MPLAPGDHVDRYEILHLLGGGGMGEVYAARDPKLEREIALKVLRDDPALATAGRAQLLREARAAATLSHPNVLAVYDVAEASAPEALRGTAYITMELVVGRSLRVLVGDESVSMATRLAMLRDVARALAAAHNGGVVHRDVKPENVMVRADGLVKVLDFGIARRAVAGSSVGAASSSATGGEVTGTLPYMSPEQLRAQPIDGRADQFSWGVLAFELLTGRLPWTSSPKGLEIAAEILSSAPAPPCTPPGLSAGMRAVVDRALAKNANARFSSMDELCRAMAALDSAEAFAPTVAIPASLEPPARSRGRAALWAALGGLVLVAGVAAALARPSPFRAPAVSSPAPAASSAPAPVPYHETDFRNRMGLGIRVVAASVPRKEIAFEDAEGLWIAPTGEGARVKVTLPASIRALGPIGGLEMFPNGDLLIGWGEEHPMPLQVVARDGSKATPARVAGSFRLSSDGKRMAFVLGRKLLIGGIDEGPTTTVASLSDPEPAWDWSPDEKWFVLGATTKPSEIQLLRADGSTTRTLLRGDMLSGYSFPQPIWRSSRAVDFFGWEKDHNVLREIVLDADGVMVGEPHALWSGDRKWRGPVAWIGSSLVESVSDGQSDVYVGRLGARYDALEGDLRRVTASEAGDYPAGWFGQSRILMTSERDGTPAVFAQPVDGGTPEKLISREPAGARPIAALDDRTFLATSKEADGLHVLRATTGDVTDLKTLGDTESGSFCAHCRGLLHPSCVLLHKATTEATLRTFDAATGELGPVFYRAPLEPEIWQCALSSDREHVLVAREHELTMVAIRDGSSKHVSFDPMPRLLQAVEELPGGAGFLATGMEFGDAPYALIHVDAQGHARAVHTSPTDWMFEPALAPNGRDVSLMVRRFVSDLKVIEPVER
jgi:serine/threonine-protein kinase